MQCAIVTIGDELLIGQVVNTNAAYIADLCTRNGAKVVTHISLPDDVSVIVSELHRLRNVVDVIITSGGLGPTHDDVTVEALATFVRKPLVQDAQWLEHLQSIMERRGLQLSERNAKQSLVPEGARVLHNSIGTAPGLILSVDIEGRSVTVVTLPGVPSEMRYLMQETVVPFIIEKTQRSGTASDYYRTLITAGITESALADVLGNPGEWLTNGSLAYLPSAQGVRLRLGVTHTNPEEAERELDKIEELICLKAGEYIVGNRDAPLSFYIGERLKRSGQTVAVAESCTGGLLGATFTQIPGSSAWFLGGVISYSNNIKVTVLGVNTSTLNDVGAVSSDVAQQMAIGVKKLCSSTWSIAITGIAGPDGGTEEKPVGTVWIGIAGPTETITKKVQLTGSREMIRERAVGTALTMFWGLL